MRFGILRPASANDNGKTGEEDNEEKKELTVEVSTLGKEHYPQLEERLGYIFKEYEVLERALTHRSAQASGTRHDYERLEFLGDAVLDLAVAHWLLELHPEAREGELSKMRAALVNTTSLAEIARELTLGQFIILSRGELANGGADRPSILADVLEAVMGAIYREAGFETALARVRALFGVRLESVIPQDPKTELQEALHAAGSEGPNYLLECVEGPEHAPTFVCVVEVDGQIVGRGRGSTKKAAQQEAASQALRMLSQKDDIDQMFLKTPPDEDQAGEDV